MESKSGKPQLETDGGNPELSLDANFVSVGRSEGMAIGAEAAQVIEPVISAVAVDVIEFQRNGPAQPTCLAAHRAFGLQDSFLQQSVPLCGKDTRQAAVEAAIAFPDSNVGR
jgi:hypothetical protein